MECICDKATCYIGYACVPIQEYNEIYSPAEGLENGTIFPELNLPINVYLAKNVRRSENEYK